MFNITFCGNGQKDCTTVEAKVNTGLDIEKLIIPFQFEAERQFSAALLIKHLNVELRRSIERAHRLGYEQGYKDGRGRQRKKKNFCTSFVERKVVGW